MCHWFYVFLNKKNLIPYTSCAEKKLIFIGFFGFFCFFFFWAVFSVLAIQLRICKCSLSPVLLVPNEGNSVINLIYVYIFELLQKRFLEQKLKFLVLTLYSLWNYWILEPVWSILCSPHHFRRSCFFLWKIFLTTIPWIWVWFNWVICLNKMKLKWCIFY